MAIEIKILSIADWAELFRAATDVFDKPVRESLAREFLSDSRHHIVVAVDEGRILGFASGLHYVHPDKPPELWVNEIAVTPAQQGKGLGKALLSALLELGRQVGCSGAWVLTDRSNVRAMQLYSSLGGRPKDQVMFSFLL